MTFLGDDTTASAITLRDSAGSALTCNYISITASGDTNNGWFRAAIDPSPAVGPLTTNSTAAIATSASTDVVTSGVCGQYASTENGAIDFVLGPEDLVNKVTIQQSEAESVRYMLTYGVIKGPTNSIRLDNYPAGR